MEYDMTPMLQMRQTELLYRDLYESADPLFYSEPAELPAFQAFLGKYGAKYQALDQQDLTPVLEEDSYFSETQDVTVFQHYRYMPGIWHEHSFFEIACVLSGQFRHYLEGEEQPHAQTLQRGDILILAPHTRHTVCAFDEDAVLINILIRSSTFESAFFDTLPEDDLVRRFFHDALYRSSFRPYLLFRTGSDPELARIIGLLRQEAVRNRRFQNTSLKAVLSYFFVQLLRDHEQDVILPDLNRAGVSDQNIYILQYMQKNCTTITLSHLAEFFNYSERQMQRIITSMTGCSFSENIRQLRMKKAGNLLADTSLPVAKIAEILGYCDTRNFRQMFKASYGMTPQEYRLRKAGCE